MEHFLLQKGETVIRAIEAGMRTSTSSPGSERDGLHRLISENLQEDDIAFIRIVSGQNILIDQAGSPGVAGLSTPRIEQIVRTETAVGDLHAHQRIFTVSSLLHSEKHRRQEAMDQPKGLAPEVERSDRRIISIGLVTDQFDAARMQDMHHTIFMGGLLFLLGSVSIYFLLLYQEIRVAKSTLTNLKLYTDNVIESIPAGLVTLDVEGRVVSGNRRSEEILRRTKAELQGKTIGEILPGSSLDLADIPAGDGDFTDQFITADGRPIPIKISGSNLINSDGEGIGTVLILRDMTTIREMEQQLERSRRMVALGKMAAGIAHEIRNPLGTLRGFAHYFGRKPEASEESKGYADLMISEVDRLNRIISGLLQFARPREPQFVAVDMDDLLAKTAVLMAGDFAKHEIRFNCPEDTGISLQADPDLLLQVLMNLIKNSIQATSAGGEVSLSCSVDERYCRIKVSDNGRGMNGHEREKMFDPFFTTGKSGTGLGLAVSHQIVEQHHGFFEVETGPAQGTKVTVVLPKRKWNEEVER